jgi:hypothetical protein
LGGTRVKKCGDVEDLLIGQRHGRHAFIGTTLTDDFPDLVTLHVMSN